MDPLRARMRTDGPVPRETQGRQNMGDVLDADEEKGKCTPSTGAPESGQGRHPAAIPAPGPPSLSVQLPSPHDSPVKHPERESSFANKCEPYQAPFADRAQWDQLTRDQLNHHCS